MPTAPKTPAAKASRTYHHGDLHQALIQAALAKIEHGEASADDISLAALAKALGVSQAAPYRHFADRDALLAAVAAEGFKAFSDALMQALAAVSSSSGLSRMCHAYVEFGSSRPGMYRLMFASNLLARAQDDALRTAAHVSFNLLVSALGPTVDAAQRERRALKIWFGLHGLVMLSTDCLPLVRQGPLTLDQLVDDLLTQ
jgi:AcrR family transcriptional regulator